MLLKIFTLVFLVVKIVVCAKSYEGYKVYKVSPKTGEDILVLNEMLNQNVFEVWEEGFRLNFAAKVMASKEKQELFLEKVKNYGIETIEVISDLQQLIEDQFKPVSKTRSTEVEEFLSMKWDNYHNLNAIYTWLDEVAANYPDVVRSVVMGTSYEGREIKGLVINYKKANRNKLIGMIEGTLHAREWISTATVTWIIKEFLTSTDPEVRSLAENYEWHIFPIVNPDGYEYTFTNRMWRKNRNPSYNTTCADGDDNMSFGVDLNRNFAHQWMAVGASDDPCSNTFAGPTSFSEPESRAIAQYVANLKDEGDFIYYIAFHSYSQLVVIPYSHVSDVTAVVGHINYADMFEVAARAAERLEKKHGTHYRVGLSADVLYPMSGTSFDWVKEQTQVPFSYLLELRDRGEFGFILPQEQIIPNCEEVMEFLLGMVDASERLGYYNINSSVSSHLDKHTTVMLFSTIFYLFVTSM